MHHSIEKCPFFGSLPSFDENLSRCFLGKFERRVLPSSPRENHICRKNLVLQIFRLDQVRRFGPFEWSVWISANFLNIEPPIVLILHRMKILNVFFTIWTWFYIISSSTTWSIMHNYIMIIITIIIIIIMIPLWLCVIHHAKSMHNYCIIIPL